MCQSPCPLLHYEKSDVGYELEVLNPQILSSIRGAHVSQSLAKNTNANANAIQCFGMLKVVHCSIVIKQQ